MIEHKKQTGSLSDIAGSERITNEELLLCECDVLIPAALSDQINVNNAEQIKAAIVLELANAPTTIDANLILFNRSVMLIPDILANAGGVVGSYFEWIQNLSNNYWEEEEVISRLKKVMISAFNEIYAVCEQEKCTMKKAAYTIAIKRILNAERLRGNL